MDSIEDRKREERFVKAWKDWALRPPHRSPHEAAAMVVGRLPKRSHSRPWWLLAAATVAISVALAVHWSTVSRQRPQFEGEARLHESLPIGEGEVLIWLDEKTPLYMTFQPPE